jgi:hypothetical protein
MLVLLHAADPSMTAPTPLETDTSWPSTLPGLIIGVAPWAPGSNNADRSSRAACPAPNTASTRRR